MTIIYPNLASPRYFATRALSNITPFTLRDAYTFEELLEGVHKYIRETLIPFISENNLEINETLAGFYTQILEGIGTSETIRDEAVAAKEAAELARDAAQMYAGEAQDVQDSAIATIVGDEDSATTILLKTLFADYVDVENIKTILATGYLSEASLDFRFNEKAEADDFKAIELIVNTGRLSNAQLDAKYVTGVNFASTVSDLEDAIEGVTDKSLLEEEYIAFDIEREFLKPKALPQFDRLKTGMTSPGSIRTTIAVLGSSTIAGGFDDYPEQSIVPRLAFRSGATSVESLDAVTAPLVGNGVRWLQGAVGGLQSGNFYQAARRAALAKANPDYVIIAVGSNDYAVGVTDVNYKSNMVSAVQHIKANSGAHIVLVHQQARKDITSPIHPWERYGVMLKEVADEHNCTFLDFNAITKMGKMTNENVWGLVGADNIHMTTEGTRMLADFIGYAMGIPNEEGYYRMTRVSPYSLPASGDRAQNDTWLPTKTFPAVNYPRLFVIKGSAYMRRSGTGVLAELNINANVGDTNVARALRLPNGTYEQSFPYEMPVYVPPMKPVTIFAAHTVTNGTVYSSGTPSYAWANLEITAI